MPSLCRVEWRPSGGSPFIHQAEIASMKNWKKKKLNICWPLDVVMATLPMCIISIVCYSSSSIWCISMYSSFEHGKTRWTWTRGVGGQLYRCIEVGTSTNWLCRRSRTLILGWMRSKTLSIHMAGAFCASFYARNCSRLTALKQLPINRLLVERIELVINEWSLMSEFNAFHSKNGIRWINQSIDNSNHQNWISPSISSLFFSRH